MVQEEAMNPYRHALILSALAASMVASAQPAGDWITVTDPKDTRDLYSDKTIRGMGWVGYYRADGRGFLVAEKAKPAGRRWTVKDNGEGCAQIDGGPNLCFRFERHRENRSLIRITDLTGGHKLTATVEPGIPDLDSLEKASRP